MNALPPTILATVGQTIGQTLAAILAVLNRGATAVGQIIFLPIGIMPGWLSNTIISCLAGVGMLYIFKLTSDQKAIGRIRDGIKADLLTVKLFKDSLPVTLAAQGRLLKGAGLLLLNSLIPLAVMIVPICLLLSQMGVWYQHAPLPPKQTIIVAMKLASTDPDIIDTVTLHADPAFETTIGPHRIPATGQVWWELRGLREGRHQMVFDVAGQQITKSLSVGTGLMPISKLRPDRTFTDVLLNPAEPSFQADSPVQWIDIQYDERQSWTSGADNWVIYFFIASMIFALAFKSALGVRI